ncbi:helix-turn-helix domain-containing protein [Brevundimonas diminuta]|uniref:helix-turn-helix domain-containing protein n=1 Tax=Brevundimonas diminuta TaxID=293 RepID=UPI003D07879D
MSTSHRFSQTRSTPRLTARQTACLELAARGLTSAAIGERLGISSRTVDEHLMRACDLLGVRTRIQAVARLAAKARPVGRRVDLPQ